MGVVRFRFKGRSDAEQLKFDGQFITVGELKRLIAAKTKLQLADATTELILSNPRTKLVFGDAFQRVASNEEVIVSRAGAAGTAPAPEPKPQAEAVIDFSDDEDDAPAAAKPAAPADNDLDEDPFAKPSEFPVIQEEEERALLERMYGSAMAVGAAGQQTAPGKPGSRIPICRYCGQPGHVVQKCPQKVADGAKEVRDVRGIPHTRINPTGTGVLYHQGGFIGEIMANERAFNEDISRFRDLDEDDTLLLTEAGEGAARGGAAAPLALTSGATGGTGGGGGTGGAAADGKMIMTSGGWYQPAPPPMPPPRARGEEERGGRGVSTGPGDSSPRPDPDSADRERPRTRAAGAGDNLQCFSCGLFGHKWRDCPMRAQQFQAVIGSGHFAPEHLDTNGVPKGFLPFQLYELMPMGPRDILTMAFGSARPLPEKEFLRMQERVRADEIQRRRVEQERMQERIEREQRERIEFERAERDRWERERERRDREHRERADRERERERPRTSKRVELDRSRSPSDRRRSIQNGSPPRGNGAAAPPLWQRVQLEGAGGGAAPASQIVKKELGGRVELGIDEDRKRQRSASRSRSPGGKKSKRSRKDKEREREGRRGDDKKRSKKSRDRSATPESDSGSDRERPASPKPAPAAARPALASGRVVQVVRGGNSAAPQQNHHQQQQQSKPALTPIAAANGASAASMGPKVGRLGLAALAGIGAVDVAAARRDRFAKGSK